MHAPEHACRDLYRFHPQLRLAWLGTDRDENAEWGTNPGSFALVQLYHVNNVGRFEDGTEHTFRAFWNLHTAEDEHGNAKRERISRGPIFNRWGGTKPDWDPLFRVPMFVATFDSSYCYGDASPCDTMDVFNGKFMLAVERWCGTSVKDRVRQSNQERYNDWSHRANDLIDKATDELWADMNKPDAMGDHTITREEIVVEQARLERKRFRQEQMIKERFQL